jgi:pyruvate/2-oxoglutarate dehydrogenase complex dihydrolipoamide dehydrogenase (E3) component
MREDDKFDRQLLANVQPSDWRNPEPKSSYHLVVIGGGTAGLITASGAAGLGARVALIEAGNMGGDCLNVGCVPSKALLRSAHAAADARNASRLGVRIGGEVSVDFPAVMQRMREIRARIAPHDSAERYQNELGVDVFLGRGSFTGKDTIDVAGRRLRFRRAVIATGARAFVPPIAGLDETGYLTNESVFDLRDRPRRLLVLGGGPIGCELAQAFQRFGTQVTVVEMMGQILGREDPDAADLVLNAFRREGIDVRLGTRLLRVEKLDGAKRAIVDHAGKEETIAFDEILVAVGRSPNVSGLDLECVGVEYDLQRGVRVDDQLRTSNPRIFSAGDVCMKYKFTHAADAAARIVIQNALFALGPIGRRSVAGLTIPWCTYTDPEVAHVGAYAHDSEMTGALLDTYVKDLSEVDRAMTDGNEDGFVKIHTTKGSDRIVGATIVAPHAGDMISEVSVAMASGTGLSKLSGIIHPYPTQADAIRSLGDVYNRKRLTPAVRRLFDVLLRLKR